MVGRILCLFLGHVWDDVTITFSYATFDVRTCICCGKFTKAIR